MRTMKGKAITLVYFSPTGTTRQIVEGITKGIHAGSVTRIDLTPPTGKDQGVREVKADAAIIGAPVYGGRIPVTAVSRLQSLKATNTPAVIVVVYGNRAYEDALVELQDLAVESGFTPVAGGAFIGEHSFHTDDTPIAKGRPDKKDLKKAREFGETIHATVEEYDALGEIPPLPVPGTHPYKERGHSLDAISPITIEKLCILCGKCAEVCPTAAITVTTEVMTDQEACIRCCACVKNCPTDARVMTHPRIKKTALWLSTDYRERREPEIYLAN
jgi:ferredoxin